MTQPTALSTAINAVVRMPVIFAGMNATLLAGETAMRILGEGLSHIGFTGENKFAKVVSDKLPDVTFNLMRPFKDLTHRQLGISLAACFIIGTLGWELCNKVLGPAPETYNDISNWVGPIRLKTDWRHPAIAWTRTQLGY